MHAADVAVVVVYVAVEQLEEADPKYDDDNMPTWKDGGNDGSLLPAAGALDSLMDGDIMAADCDGRPMSSEDMLYCRCAKSELGTIF